MNVADEASFVEFVSARSSALLRTCFLLTGDHGHAEDLLQATMAQCYRHWPRVHASGREEAYVRAAMLNTHISIYRRRKLREVLAGQLPERSGRREADAVDDRDQLRRSLGRLPARMRVAVVLRHYEGRSEAETATAMNCSPGNIKSLTSRGLARLRADLAPDPLMPTVGASLQGGS